MYSALAFGYAVTIQSLELYFKVLHEKAFFHSTYHGIAIFVMPLFSLIVNGLFGSFGFGNFYPWCFTVNTTRQAAMDFLVYYGPGALCVSTIFYCTFVVIVKIVKTLSIRRRETDFENGEGDQQLESNSSECFCAMNDKMWQYLKSISVAHAVVVLMISVLVLTFTTFVQVLIDLTHKKAYAASFNAWANCVFTSFNGMNDATWISVCGHHPPVRSQRINIFLLVSHSLFVGIIFFPYEYYYSHAANLSRWILRFSRHRANKSPRIAVDVSTIMASSLAMDTEVPDFIPTATLCELEPAPIAAPAQPVVYNNQESDLPRTWQSQHSSHGSGRFRNIYTIIESHNASTPTDKVTPTFEFDSRNAVEAPHTAGAQFTLFKPNPDLRNTTTNWKKGGQKGGSGGEEVTNNPDGVGNADSDKVEFISSHFAPAPRTQAQDHGGGGAFVTVHSNGRSCVPWEGNTEY